jgi:uncharacterized protein YlaI
MCPICDSVNVSPSKKRKIRDLFMKPFAQVPYRCRDCKSRFYISVSRIKEAEQHRQWLLSVRDREEKTAGRVGSTETVTNGIEP